jgi:hypothetical protein
MCSKFLREYNIDVLRLFPSIWMLPHFGRTVYRSRWRFVFPTQTLLMGSTQTSSEGYELLRTWIYSVTMKFPEWLYCKPHTCTLTAYWEGSPSKYSPWAGIHLAQRCWYCWEHFWNSCCGIAFSDVIFFSFGCLQYPEIFVPLRQTSFLGTV